MQYMLENDKIQKKWYFLTMIVSKSQCSHRYIPWKINKMRGYTIVSLAWKRQK